MDKAQCMACSKDFDYKRNRNHGKIRKYCSMQCVRNSYWSKLSDQDKKLRCKAIYEKKVIKLSEDECWSWKDSLSEKYGVVICGGKKIRAHRLSWLVHFGELTSDQCVLHSCDNPPCSNPKHLFLGTRADNNKDMVNKKRNKGNAGSSNGRATITESIVVELKRLLSFGESPTKLSHDFNISRTIIYSIKYGVTWSHIS